jgi:hypothetical protein
VGQFALFCAKSAEPFFDSQHGCSMVAVSFLYGLIHREWRSHIDAMFMVLKMLRSFANPLGLGTSDLKSRDDLDR